MAPEAAREVTLKAWPAVARARRVLLVVPGVGAGALAAVERPAGRAAVAAGVVPPPVARPVGRQVFVAAAGRIRRERKLAGDSLARQHERVGQAQPGRPE